MNAHHRRAVIRRVALSCGLLVALVTTMLRAGAQNGGPQDPVPVIEPPTASKSVFVSLNFTAQEQATLTSGQVVFGRPPVRIGNPPQLEVVLKDKAGNVVERYNAWHPLGDSREASGAGDTSAVGSFPYAFQPAVRTMDIVDLPQQKLLASVDVVAAAIRPFCEQNPGDADCAADLGLTKGDAPDPVAAGDLLTYTLVASNRGPNPAYSTRIVDTLPAGVTFQSADAPCTEAPARTLTCDLGVVDPNETRQVTITVRVAADLVYNAGAPVTIGNTATIGNRAGNDPNGGNNNASAQTRVVAVADLAVDSFAAVSPPPQVILGRPATVTLRAVASNGGPSSPMDATLSRGASATPGASVTPVSSSASIVALAVGAPRTIDETYTLNCSKPGYQTYRFTTAIRPSRPDDSDPNPANNERAVALTIDCVVPVAINIKPGSNPNSVNLGNGTIAVAVLSTRVGEYGLPLAFNATTILPLTVRFGPTGMIAAGLGVATEVHGEGHLEDSLELGDRERVRDGDTDMVLHFAGNLSGLLMSDTEACVKGEFIAADGNRYRFFGCDLIRPTT